ncbi:UBX domain-containing protein 7 isoform X2 [Chrysemys picta bellii]|uniref:UBX domain-containing protein 7 isoform X2 n=1 Tax=Chrysemys picta bellii TaxID=8478 RepID=UPI0032B24117
MTVCEQNHEKIDGTVAAKVLNIGLKRNVEHMLSTLKPISVTLNKMQGNSCSIADAVEIGKELSEILKREICNDRIKSQALKKTNGSSTIHNTWYQGQALTVEEEELAMTWTSSNHPSVMPTIINFSAKGASESVGKHMLEACNNNLEMAVTMFLDGGGIAEEPSTSSAAVSTVRPDTEDEVRAPIPQKQEILVEPEPLFGAPKRRRPARSIFDGFRDFQTETIRQEQELRNGGAIDKKLTTLADLFRPPIDLMHKGSFETAKECGQMQNKWLMINIQNVQDFACQCLNRDVWSNEAVKNIIREHFIFWQVYHDSEEGQRYIQFYKLADFPYVSILDPRTGQKLVEWHQLDVTSFLDQVTGFLGEHGQLDGHSTSPPQKCSRSESLIDASEDSQMEAAIRASLQETHFDSSQVKQDSRSDEESESELFSGSEEFISVCGSDDDDESENPAKSRKSPHKDLGCRKEESRRPPPEPPTRTEPGTTSNHRVVSSIDAEILEESADKPDSAVEGLDVNGPKAQLMLRYPDGKREQISLPEQAKLLALVKHVQSKGYPNERFELLTNFPRRKLSHLDYDITLQEAGLCPQETVFVQERN